DVRADTAAQANVQVPFPQVNLTQVVFAHQLDQMLDGPQVERTGDVRGFVRHLGPFPEKGKRGHSSFSYSKKKNVPFFVESRQNAQIMASKSLGTVVNTS